MPRNDLEQVICYCPVSVFDSKIYTPNCHSQQYYNIVSSFSALQRYLFYCNRYMNHMQSLKFEHKLYASVKDKMEEMQQHNMSWIEVQFLKKVSTPRV